MKLYLKKLIMGAVYALAAFTLYVIVFHYLQHFNASVLIGVLTVAAVAVLVRILNKKQKNDYLSDIPADGVLQKNELSCILRQGEFKAELAAFITFAVLFHVGIFFKSAHPLHVLLPALFIMFIMASVAFAVLDITSWLLVRAVWKRSA